MKLHTFSKYQTTSTILIILCGEKEFQPWTLLLETQGLSCPKGHWHALSQAYAIINVKLQETKSILTEDQFIAQT